MANLFYHNHLKTLDASSYIGVRSKGLRSNVTMWDYRIRADVDVDAWIFAVTFSDFSKTSEIEIRCNWNDLLNESDAEYQSSKYGMVLGRIPELFRSRLTKIDVHKGTFKNKLKYVINGRILLQFQNDSSF